MNDIWFKQRNGQSNTGILGRRKSHSFLIKKNLWIIRICLQIILAGMGNGRINNKQKINNK